MIEAYDWYERRSPGLGGAFLAEVDRQATRIAENQLQFPVILSDVRQVRLRRFPYGLFSGRQRVASSSSPAFTPAATRKSGATARSVRAEAVPPPKY